MRRRGKRNRTKLSASLTELLEERSLYYIYFSVDRYGNVVQVLDAGHYELLLRQGLDFFGAARFSAIPERWWRGGSGSTGGPLQAGPGMASNFLEVANFQTGDGVLQCYRCQGFWHMAANCRHLPRCVRCGEPHSVEFCPRPRNNPICCHCSGPHHAGIYDYVHIGVEFYRSFAEGTWSRPANN